MWVKLTVRMMSLSELQDLVIISRGVDKQGALEILAKLPLDRPRRQYRPDVSSRKYCLLTLQPSLELGLNIHTSKTSIKFQLTENYGCTERYVSQSSSMDQGRCTLGQELSIKPLCSDHFREKLHGDNINATGHRYPPQHHQSVTKTRQQDGSPRPKTGDTRNYWSHQQHWKHTRQLFSNFAQAKRSDSSEQMHFHSVRRW